MAQTIQVPTLRLNAFRISRPYQRADFDAALAKLPAGPLRSAWQADAAARREQGPGDLRSGEWSLRLVAMMHGRGVAIGAGTDTPISLAIPGYSLHTELELLVRAGLSPLEALEAATLVPARFLSLDDEMGGIAVGQRADLVLLDANPLEDIRNTRRIAGVVTRGRWLGGDALDSMLRAGP
jgi:imidazolonepropionase-like amidohydrolase